ncbi:hypothetical protein AK812_SmicGene45573 [Symbiodinium microadriaticum]|uniref:Uncharacterized protein n=1 Tax=Symbiodinium microadriaticum TaxID=2951 RepID=A0A1Q9BVS1_SYMMI|nr:hypothetical protein AK812_SmicGene45573 [Symbiodinium microadriaticum]
MSSLRLGGNQRVAGVATLGVVARTNQAYRISNTKTPNGHGHCGYLGGSPLRSLAVAMNLKSSTFTVLVHSNGGAKRPYQDPLPKDSPMPAILLDAPLPHLLSPNSSSYGSPAAETSGERRAMKNLRKWSA